MVPRARRICDPAVVRPAGRYSHRPGHAQRTDVQLLLAAGTPALSSDRLPSVVPELATGLAAVAARSAGQLGPWTGRISALAELDNAFSATGLQTYAACPHSYLLGKVLRIRDQDEPDDEEASPLDIGVVVHEALEAFFRSHAGRSPDAAWIQAEHAAAHDVLDGFAANLAAEGKAGRPLVWANRLRQMHRGLRGTLLADDSYRRERRARPQKTELGFGLDDPAQPAVELQLPSGRTVSLRGSIDRVDVRDDGGLIVLDWTTGRSKDYKELAGDTPDLVGGGRHLQLPLYAEAAIAWYGQPADVDAFYVLVEQGAQRRGGAVDHEQRARLHEALDTLSGAASGGLFPMNPGEDGFFGWENCRYCPFDRLCPSSRGTQWEHVRSDPALAGYLAVTEPVTAP